MLPDQSENCQGDSFNENDALEDDLSAETQNEVVLEGKNRMSESQQCVNATKYKEHIQRSPSFTISER